MTIGARLRKLRKERRWTLHEVALKLGLKGHSTYSNWEYNRAEPDGEMLTRLSALFKVSVTYLVTGSNDQINLERNKTEDELNDDYKGMTSELSEFIELVKGSTDEEIMEQFERYYEEDSSLHPDDIKQIISYTRFLLQKNEQK